MALLIPFKNITILFLRLQRTGRLQKGRLFFSHTKVNKKGRYIRGQAVSFSEEGITTTDVLTFEDNSSWKSTEVIKCRTDLEEADQDST